jgi:hypothetical protein
MTMTGRFLEPGIRILATVALLAVMSSPIRPTGASRTAPSPDDLPRYLVIFDHGYCGESAMSIRPSLREEDPLRSDVEDELDAEIEDELTAKPLPATVSIDILSSPCPEPHRERISFSVMMAARPLRC